MSPVPSRIFNSLIGPSIQINCNGIGNVLWKFVVPFTPFWFQLNYFICLTLIIIIALVSWQENTDPPTLSIDLSLHPSDPEQEQSPTPLTIIRCQQIMVLLDLLVSLKLSTVCPLNP